MCSGQTRTVTWTFPTDLTMDTTCANSVTETEFREVRLAKLRQNKVFEPGIGEVEGFEACLQLKEDHIPVNRKARTVPYALKEKIESTIDRMVDNGILVQVKNSQYASPIVPVEKDDGTVQICGDYKSTLNPNLETKQYPLPTVECFQTVCDGQKFQKLDIRQAYSNLKLPYGISSSTAIFQQKMYQVLEGCKAVVCRVDDILVTGKTEGQHLSNLEEVVNRLISGVT